MSPRKEQWCAANMRTTKGAVMCCQHAAQKREQCYAASMRTNKSSELQTCTHRT